MPTRVDFDKPKCTGPKDRFGHCIRETKFEPQTRKHPPKPHPTPTPTPEPFPTPSTFDYRVGSDSAMRNAGIGGGVGAVAGGGLGLGLGMGRGLATVGEEAGGDIEEGVVARSSSRLIARSSSRLMAVASPPTKFSRTLDGLRNRGYQSVATEEDGEAALADESTAARNVGSKIASKGMQTLRNLRNVFSSTSHQYEAVATEDADIEMGHIGGAQDAMDDASELVTKNAGVAAEDADDLAAIDDTVNDARSALTSVGENAVGENSMGDLFGNAFGADEGSAIEMTSIGEGGSDIASSLGSDEGASLLTDIGSSEAGSEAISSVFDVETLGLAAVGAAVVGLVGGLVGYFTHKNNKTPPPPGLTQINLSLIHI